MSENTVPKMPEVVPATAEMVFASNTPELTTNVVPVSALVLFERRRVPPPFLFILKPPPLRTPVTSKRPT